MAAQAGFAPAPFRLTDGRTTVIPLSKLSLEGRAPPFLHRIREFQKRARRARPSNTTSMKLVTAAGLAPAVTWSQARHVAPTLRGVAPAYWERKPGACFLWRRGLAAPWNRRRVGDWRPRWDLHPHSSRRQRVAFLFSYEGWWEVLVTLQFVASDLV